MKHNKYGYYALVMVIILAGAFNMNNGQYAHRHVLRVVLTIGCWTSIFALSSFGVDRIRDVICYHPVTYNQAITNMPLFVLIPITITVFGGCIPGFSFSVFYAVSVTLVSVIKTYEYLLWPQSEDARIKPWMWMAINGMNLAVIIYFSSFDPGYILFFLWCASFVLYPALKRRESKVRPITPLLYIIVGSVVVYLACCVTPNKEFNVNLVTRFLSQVKEFGVANNGFVSALLNHNDPVQMAVTGLELIAAWVLAGVLLKYAIQLKKMHALETNIIESLASILGVGLLVFIIASMVAKPVILDPFKTVSSGAFTCFLLGFVAPEDAFLYFERENT